MAQHRAAACQQSPVLRGFVFLKTPLKLVGVQLFPADPSYRKESAEDGWKKLQDWFKQRGVV